MLSIFVINPKAGQGKAPLIETAIEETAEERGLTLVHDENGGAVRDCGADIVIYETKSVGDAETYCRLICSAVKPLIEGVVRFYACGGDGTLNEVVNGCAGADGVEIACIPLGTGNDFIKTLPGARDYLDIGRQLDGAPMTCDAIRYSYLSGETKTERYAINICNMGLDCNVADLTGRMKRVPLISGHFAYYLSALAMLVRKKGEDLKVDFDGERKYDGKLLLITIANGEYYGGGVKAAPNATADNGLLELSILRGVKRREFARLFPIYKKGEHLQDPDARAHFELGECKTVTVTPNTKNVKLCVDGEITLIKDAGEMTFTIVPGAVQFVLPAE